MSHRVLLLPSQHEFQAHAQQSILEAALGSGLTVDYGCTTGSCGECRARLVSGEVEQIRHHDFTLPAAERGRGWFLPCAYAARSDLVLEAREAGGVEDIPVQRIVAKVSRIDAAGRDVRIVQIRTPRSDTLRFLAGQQVVLQFAQLEPRRLTIASCPCNGMVLQVHVCRTPDDPFSEFVFSGLRTGTPVVLEGPFGSFVFDEQAHRPLLFIAHRTGFAAVKSLIEHAVALEWPLPMRLYWIAPNPDGHYLANQARAWEDALDDFRYTPLFQLRNTHTQCIPAQPAFDELDQMIAAVAAEHPEYREYETYVAGPGPLGDSVRERIAPAELHVSSAGEG